MGTELEVDPGRVAALAADLDGWGRELDALAVVVASAVRSAADGLGSGELGVALGAAAWRWEAVAGELLGQTGATVSAAREAATDYADTERRCRARFAGAV